MKKFIILGLVLVCLCFSGCGITNEEGYLYIADGYVSMPTDEELMEVYVNYQNDSIGTEYYGVLDAEASSADPDYIHFVMYDGEGNAHSAVICQRYALRAMIED